MESDQEDEDNNNDFLTIPLPHRCKRKALIKNDQLQRGLELIREERKKLKMELAEGELPLKILGKNSTEGTPNDKCKCESLIRYAQVWFACL
jgi:hypothetical protein